MRPDFRARARSRGDRRFRDEPTVRRLGMCLWAIGMGGLPGTLTWACVVGFAMLLQRLPVVLQVLVTVGCSSSPAASTEPSESGAGDPLGFAHLVFPMLKEAGCDECHEPTRKVTSHWALTTPEETYAQWLNEPGFDHCDDAGAAISVPRPKLTRVVAGEPDASLVLKKLRDPWENCGAFYGHMPPPPRMRLADDRIDLVRAWIVAGAHP